MSDVRRHLHVDRISFLDGGRQAGVELDLGVVDPGGQFGLDLVVGHPHVVAVTKLHAGDDEAVFVVANVRDGGKHRLESDFESFAGGTASVQASKLDDAFVDLRKLSS